jgi:hypothetical protein
MAPSATGVVAGITKSALTDAKNATDRDGNPLFPDLANVRTSSGLTVEQVAAIYRYQTDQNFDTVGGSAALDKVGDSYAAAALNDTMFWQVKVTGRERFSRRSTMSPEKAPCQRTARWVRRHSKPMQS